MKKLMFAFVLVMLFSGLFAQAPQGITHQAVIRNVANELVTQTLIGVQVSILQGSAEGTAVFVETHSPTSNAHGLITYVIGKGTNVSGSFENIAWAAGPYFLKTEADPGGRTNYTITGTTQFLSVPYALHAGSSSDNQWEQIGNNIFTRNTGNVGIGINNPNHKLEVYGNARFGWQSAGFLGLGGDFLGGEIGLFDITGDKIIAGKLYSGSHSGTYVFGDNLFIRLGNVGIGTQNPQHKLHVAGNAQFASDIGIGRGFIYDEIGITDLLVDRLIAGKPNAETDLLYQYGGQPGTSEGLFINAGNVGIGTTTPIQALDIEGQIRIGGGNPGPGKVLTSDEEGVGTWQAAGLSLPYIGTYNGEEASFQVENTLFGTGIVGAGATGVKGVGTTGVYGESSYYDGYGVHGRVFHIGSGSPYGVYGENLCSSGAGVHGSGPIGVSGTGFTGVEGRSHTGGTGVYGYSSAETGSAYGVFGRSDSESGRAVFGWATRNNGNTYGGYFESKSSEGKGVYGVATATTGTTYGVFGQNKSTTTGSAAVYGLAEATSGSTSGIYGISKSNSGRGVFGWADASTGNTYGVYGLNSSSSGRGLYGWASASAGTTYGVYGFSSSPDGYGVYSNGRFAATGTKSFQIDHPLDPANKYLNHYCTEGAEPLNVYSGNVITDGKGFATVSLPEYFESINRDFRYQLTVIDDSDDFVFAKVTQEVQNSRFIIRTSKPDVKVSWRVEGVRNDHWVKHHGAMAEQEKPAEHRGKYLNPEFFEMPKEMGVHFQPDIERPKNSKPQEFEHIEPQGPAQGVNQQFEHKENQ